MGLAMSFSHGWLLYLNKCGHEFSGSVQRGIYFDKTMLTYGKYLIIIIKSSKSCKLFWQNYVKKISILSMTLSFGRAMAQAVSSRPLTAEALVRPHASPYGGTPAGFLEYIFPPYHYTNAS